MTSPFAAQTRPQQQPGGYEQRGPRRLQSVRSERSAARAMRIAGGFAMVVVVVALFGLVTFNAVIVQQQRAVDDLNTNLVSASAENEQLRVRLTQLEAPDRIVKVAKGQLGMIAIEPSKVTYLTPPQSELDATYVVSVIDAASR